MDGELSSALGNKNYFYKIIGCGAQKSSQTLKSGLKLKKTRPLRLIAAKLTSAWAKPFAPEYDPELWDCNRVGQIFIPTL